MKIPIADGPEITEAACREATGKTFQEWYAVLDQAGGVAKGRRDLTNLVYDQCNKEAWWSTTIVVEYESARGKQEKDGRPTGYAICATKTIAASVPTVYAAFTNGDRLNGWWGPKSKVDAVPGGKLENADGDLGTFQRVRADKDLRFTWEHAEVGGGSLVDVAFADKGKGKTGITLNHSRIVGRADSDRLRAAWSEALDRLKSLLEG